MNEERIQKSRQVQSLYIVHNRCLLGILFLIFSCNLFAGIINIVCSMQSVSAGDGRVLTYNVLCYIPSAVIGLTYAWFGLVKGSVTVYHYRHEAQGSYTKISCLYLFFIVFLQVVLALLVLLCILDSLALPFLLGSYWLSAG